MGLENFFTKSKNSLRKTFITGLASSIIFISACGGSPPNNGPPSPDPTPQENEETYILPESEIDFVIESVGENNIIFNEPVNYSPGDTIVAGISSDTPDGLLRKIISISSDGRTVYTEQGTLEDAIKDGSFSYQGAISPQNTSLFSTNRSSINSLNLGILDFSLSLDNVVIYDADENLSTTNDQIVANGNLSFSSEIVFEFDVQERVLRRLAFENIINKSSTLEIISGVSSNNINEETKIAGFNFPSFTAGYVPTPFGPIPVIVKPQVEVYVGLNGDLSPLKTSVSQNITLTAGVMYNNGQWSPVGNFSNDFSFVSPELSEHPNFKATVGPRLNFLIYGVVGPSVGVNDYLEINSDTDSWSLYGGLEALAGVQMSIFSHSIANYSAVVIDSKTFLDSGEILQPGKLTKLTFGAHDDAPDWSPDGSKIIYESLYGVRIMDSDGGNNLKISNYGIFDPSFSPDGTRILYSSVIPSGIHTMNLDGSGKQRLTENVFDVYPEWSPDGTKIAFIDAGNNGVWTMSSNGNNGKMLTDPPRNGSADYHPNWHPNGSRIIFKANRTDLDGIYSMDLNGNDLIRISDGGSYTPEISYSPDGTKILFSDWNLSHSTEDIYLMNADGTNRVNLTNHPSRDFDASFSPDGRQIAFVSDRSGKKQIYKLVLP